MSGISYRRIKFVKLSDGGYIRYPWNWVKTDLGWMIEPYQSPCACLGDVSGIGLSHMNGFLPQDDILRIDKIEFANDGFDDPYYRDSSGLPLHGGKVDIDVRID